MSAVGRTWELWAYRYEGGEFWHIGGRPWVKLHQLPCPLVPVLVEEMLDDPYAPEVTHYGWQYAEGSRYRHSDVPTMIQVRTGMGPQRAMMLLSMCFPYGLEEAVARKGTEDEGAVVALRITERQDVR